ncbi:tyrosine-type recombinase/integrase [Xanthobacter sp.]|uniref:tyrosine-type recombinase/integrase n=1 Tax=Xanthobacter sp. TaxID=35809 RepID=UPI0025D7C7D7|nr:tyrosine-type recombinase/integrase [Xanthobacter sp.]
MPRPRPPHLHRQRTRHGETVWYVRRGHGPRTRIRAPYDTPEFWAEYRAAIEGAPAPAKGKKPHSLEWGIDLYRRGSAWAALSQATRRQSENIFRKVIATAGAEPLAKITPAVILAGRERRAASPHAANNFLKTMRRFFAWAAGDGGLVAVDPTKGVSLLKGRNDDDGFHTWTEDEVSRFEARWPLGTREHLALYLLLYTGFRRGDVVRLGRQHVRDGIITFRTEKTGTVVTIPVLPPLARAIEATDTGDLTFLVTERRQPFVKESFGNWFRKACREAGCPGSAHGLRKAGATRAAENGATERELMALFGWSSAKMAQHYTKAADARRLALGSAHKLLGGQSENEIRPHLQSGEGMKPKKGKKSDS